MSLGREGPPAPDGRPGLIRTNRGAQGDWDGAKDLYRINAVDCITQWRVAATVQTISKVASARACVPAHRCAGHRGTRRSAQRSVPTRAANNGLTTALRMPHPRPRWIRPLPVLAPIACRTANQERLQQQPKNGTSTLPCFTTHRADSSRYITLRPGSYPILFSLSCRTR